MRREKKTHSRLSIPSIRYIYNTHRIIDWWRWNSINIIFPCHNRAPHTHIHPSIANVKTKQHQTIISTENRRFSPLCVCVWERVFRIWDIDRWNYSEMKVKRWGLVKFGECFIYRWKVEIFSRSIKLFSKPSIAQRKWCAVLRKSQVSYCLAKLEYVSKNHIVQK